MAITRATGSPRLLDRRLLFVTGKGGVGKSVISRALADVAARGKSRVLLARFADEASPPEQVAEHLWSLSINGRDALDEYLGKHLPEALHRRVVHSRMYRQFASAAPGLAELMAMGKIADEIRWGSPDAPWDLMVVDGPASGHALELLAMPRATTSAFGEFVRKEAQRIVDLFEDPRRASVLMVTTPEELAVEETIEAVAKLAPARIAVGPVVVNAVWRAPVPPEELPPPRKGTPALVREALACGREQATRARMHREYIDQLGRELPLERLEVPFFFAEPVAAAIAEALAVQLAEGA